MPLPSTMTPIATFTLTADTGTVLFTAIPQDYTDLRIIIQTRVASASQDYFSLRFNSDSGANYSLTYLAGSPAGAQSSSFTGFSQGIVGWGTSNAESATNYSLVTAEIMNYSNSTTYKTFISKTAMSNARSDIQANMWRSTAAITAVSLATWGAGTFGANSMKSGTTLTIYGIKAA